MTELKNYTFEPGARSIVQMGEELIGHPTTAINELVKNGYDADATISKVYLNYNKDNSKSFIVIYDNGLGMPNDVLFGDWLQPSVSKKRLGEGKTKIFNRNFLGSKGIGRLASMALGRYLTVVTKTAEEDLFNFLVIDREQFKEEALLSKIKFPGGTSPSVSAVFKQKEIIEYKKSLNNSEVGKFLKDNKVDSSTEGTIIIVETLDDSIRAIVEDEFLNADLAIENMSLVRALRILITPLLLNPVIQDELISKKILNTKYEFALPESTFEIFFGSNLLPISTYDNGFFPIEEYSILSNYDYRILGKVKADGAVEGIYYCNRLIEDTFEDIFSLTAQEVFSDETSRVRKLSSIERKELSELNVGEFYFDVRIYDRDPDSMERLSKILKSNGRREAGYLLDDIVGLRISKNGFGIKPYGEEDKDWMGLSQMRVQNPTAVIGTNQLIGNIFLFSPENDSLDEKTNREGFFENEAFISFKKILRSILIEGGKRRYNYRQKHSIGRKATSKHDRPDPTRFLELLKKLIPDEKVISEAQSYVDEITTTLENLENSLSFSQRLATLGSGLELVYHELAQPIAIIGKCLFSLKFPVSQISKVDLREEILTEVAEIKTAVSTLDTLKESLEPAIGKSRKRDFKPVDTFNKVIYLLTKDIVEFNIVVEVDESLKSYQIKDYEYNFWISFLNILNNAIYWLKTTSADERKILFKKGLDGELMICNTGPKIKEDELENIFNYGVTEKSEKNATGLGLSFTRSVLSTNDWEIWAENEQYGPKFTLKKK